MNSRRIRSVLDIYTHTHARNKGVGFNSGASDVGQKREGIRGLKLLNGGVLRLVDKLYSI